MPSQTAHRATLPDLRLSEQWGIVVSCWYFIVAVRRSSFFTVALHEPGRFSNVCSLGRSRSAAQLNVRAHGTIRRYTARALQTDHFRNGSFATEARCPPYVRFSLDSDLFAGALTLRKSALSRNARFHPAARKAKLRHPLPCEIFTQYLSQSVGIGLRRHKPEILAGAAHQIDDAGVVDRVFPTPFVLHFA